MQDTVQSVDRTLNILELLSDYPDGLGVSEIGKKLALHKSTVHRLLLTLIKHGYVKQSRVNSNYDLTLKLFELGNKKVESLDLLTIAQPYLKKLMELTNEVVHFGVREDSEIVYLAKVEAPRSIKVYSRVGMRKPMYCTAMGKAMLSQLSADEIEMVWKQSSVSKMTEYSITKFTDFTKEIALTKSRGYALDNQEIELGIKCIGAVIRDYKNAICGAISLSCSIFSLTAENEQKYIQLILEYSAKISQELGYKENAIL